MNSRNLTAAVLLARIESQRKNWYGHAPVDLDTLIDELAAASDQGIWISGAELLSLIYELRALHQVVALIRSTDSTVVSWAEAEVAGG